MFQYGGGVGAWITGAATYGINLVQMTEQVWDTLPAWARDEAAGFLEWLYGPANDAYAKTLARVGIKVDTLQITAEDGMAELDAAAVRREERKAKTRHMLAEEVFIACDAIKRLWRRAHPRIVSYWKEIEDTIFEAIQNPGVQLDCRRLKIRRDGAWLRVGLPSGRALCYPHPAWDLKITKANGETKVFPGFSYMGISMYSKQWERISSYGGKVLENVTQAGACDVLLESGLPIEAAGFEIVLSVHDEWVCEADADRDDLNEDLLGSLMCNSLTWTEGLPLAAAGFTSQRYRKD